MRLILNLGIGLSRPELLSPVANFETCKAAVQNGADAIYVGVPNFNARRHGTSITIDELKKITHYARLYGVKVYFACNILIFDSELENFAETALPWLELCPDAVILQDIGLARWFRKAVSWIPIHASTQMTIASSNAVRLAAEIGFSRCILARELSIEQIKEIRKDCLEMELEVFVHGALCISYSGQCNASLIFGGRSANRGECAQCCRLPYSIYVDGKFKQKNYAFSAKDLCTLPILDELLKSGVSSLKIEGRLKSTEYVATATSAYRKALDKSGDFDRKKLEIIYSRSFTHGWLKPSERQSVVSGNSSGHIGFLLGNVERASGNKIWIKTKEECQAGDGIVILGKNIEDKNGGRVYNVKREGNLLCLSFAKEKNFGKITYGFKAYINNSPHLKKTEEPRKKPEILISGKMSEKMIRQYRQKSIEREFLGIEKINFKKFEFIYDNRNMVATPQIHQNSDIKFLEAIIKSKPDCILVRSLGAFEFLRNKGIELCGDFSLNVCNSLAAEYFLENGMKTIRPALDLETKNDASTFHTKHCLFSAVLADNKIFPYCGSPCKFHTLEIEDHKGERYVVVADVGCRNSMYFV